MTILEIFTQPFMQRALIGGLFLGALLAFLGVYVLIRKMSFFGDGLAHASLGGIAIGLLLGWQPLVVAICWAVLVAVVMYFFERRTRLSSDTVIGIFFTASLALGVILINLQPGYQPDLMTFLFGNILAVSLGDAILITLVSTGILLVLTFWSRPLTLLALDKQQAELQGIKVNGLTVFLYVVLAVAVVLGVKLVGVILVSALLIVPAAAAKLCTRSFRTFLTSSVVVALIVVFCGLVLSYWLDWPSGATIVLVGLAAFLLSWMSSKLFLKQS